MKLYPLKLEATPTENWRGLALEHRYFTESLFPADFSSMAKKHASCVDDAVWNV